MPRLLRRVGRVALLLLLVWLGGLAWFIVAGLLVTVDRATSTDAIVVLTGGRLRLEAGVALLADGRARKLFVSGVNPRVDREALLKSLGPAAEREACCIVLGRAAENTSGNARETAVWMDKEGYRSLRLVTSWYHMRRSLLEFSREMPPIAIVADPVFPRRADPEGWRDWLRSAPLAIVEYHKYLAALLRPLIDRLWRGQAGPPPALRAAHASSSPPTRAWPTGAWPTPSGRLP